MRNIRVLIYRCLIMILIISLSELKGFCQLPESVGFKTTEVGQALPSTGAEQIPPHLTHVSAVAPDVICLEIDACRVIPCIQIPYIPDPKDVITEGGTTGLGEKRNIFVVRDGFQLGTLVGQDRKTITLYERIAGINLDTEAADRTASFQIRSFEDNNYIKTISPQKVMRKSRPTGWTDSSWQLSGIQYATSKHFLYLQLPYPLKEKQTYLISFPDLDLESSAVYYVHDPAIVRSEAVHVSQIGFRSGDPDKSAFLSIWMGSGGGYKFQEGLNFSLINDITNEKVYTGKAVMQWEGAVPEMIGSRKNHNGTDVIRLDFSSFNIPGTYRISVEGIGCSYPFNLGEETTWKHAFEISMKGVFNHRSGVPMEPPYTDFVRPRSFHPEDGVKVYQSTTSLLNSGNGLNALGTDKNNFDNLVAGKTDILVPEAWGGYMDAGDWDRRINHLLTPRLYLELFELNPEYFKNLCLYIPESDNDLPDIVDEALFGLDIYRRMQLPDGGIRGGVESSEHPIEGSTSWQETQTVLAYAPDHWSSYIYAGVASRAAYALHILGKDEQALVWKESAEKAMQWAEVEYEKWISSPDYSKVRESAKRRVPFERNLAAIDLYRITNDKKWHKVFLATLSESRADAKFVYSRLDKSMVDRKVQKNAVDSLIAEADRIVWLSANNAFGLTVGASGRPMGGYSCAYTIPASETLVRAHFLTGKEQYLKTIIRSALYSAGANPLNMCMTTGLGENPVKNALHEDSRHTGQPAPVGITVFGPCELPFSDARPGSVLERRLNVTCSPAVAEWPTSESFFDVFWFVAQNEYVIDRPLGQTAYIWGYLASRK